MPSKPRPKWTDAIRMFVSDEVLNEKYGFPMDGSDDWVHDLIETAVDEILCNIYGHDIIDDQCGIPAHRFCIYCGRLESVLNE